MALQIRDCFQDGHTAEELAVLKHVSVPFANPTQARYDAEDAKLAWRRTLSFLKEKLK